jgi:hypothetical protein
MIGSRVEGATANRPAIVQSLSDNAANLEPSHEAVAKQRLEIPTGTTALWRDGTGKLDSSHSFLTTEQMLTIVKAGCGKSARPVWEADGG